MKKNTERNLPGRIANSIESAILDDNIDKLPTEFELADRYNVSRTAIREALNILKERGLVRSKTGEGPLVTKPDSRYLSRFFFKMILYNNIKDSEVSEIRVILEGSAAYLASKNKSPEFLKALADNIEEMKKVKDNLEKRVKLDIEFHRIIARQSNNPILSSFIESLGLIMRQYIKCRLIERPQGNEDGIMWHSFLLNVFTNGTPRECEESMRTHLISSFYQVESGKAMKYWLGYTLDGGSDGKENLGRRIASQIEMMYIMDGEGRRLPTEFELTEKFGVSRTVIREALGILKARGLIESRVGSGTYATAAGYDVEETLSRMTRFNHYEPRDINHLRVILEMGAASHAATNKDDEFIEKLRENLEEMKPIPYENIDRRIDVDLEFHYLIANQSNNVLLLIFIQALTELIRDLIKQNVIHHPESYQHGIDWHEKLIDALASGDPSRAEAVMRGHLTDVFHQY